MNRTVMWVSLIFCAVLQAVTPAWERMGIAKLPLILAAVLFYALTRKPTQVVEAAMLGGILQDSLGQVPLGFSSTVFCLVGLTVNRFRERLFSDHWVTHILVGVAAVNAVIVLQYLQLVAAGIRELPASLVFLKMLGSVVLASLCAPIVYRAIARMDRMMGNDMGGMR